MLIGEYIHTIDDKSRVSLPVKFRKELGKKIIVTPGFDKCLFIFTTKEWEKISKQLSTSSFFQSDRRGLNRLMFGRARETDVDSIGRILIPDSLKSYINPKDKVALIGVEDRVEVWNDKDWAQYKQTMERQADQLAEKMGNA